MVTHDLVFHKGVNISLASVENDVLLATSKGNLMVDWLELQCRVLVVARLLINEASCGLGKEVEDLERKLDNSKSSLNLALESRASLNDKVTKFATDLVASQADIDDLKTRCTNLEKRDVDRLAEVRRVEEKLLEEKIRPCNNHEIGFCKVVANIVFRFCTNHKIGFCKVVADIVFGPCTNHEIGFCKVLVWCSLWTVSFWILISNLAFNLCWC